MKKYVAQKRQSLKDFTDETYPQGSFAFARLLRDRDVRVNGVKAGRGAMLSAGDEVTYYTTAREEAKPFYTLVYRDENILVADKFSGVNSEALFSQLREECGARFIHRLDRNTCGIMAFALCDDAEAELLAAFRERRAEKIYEALCFRPFKEPRGTLEAYLRKDERAARVTVSAAPRAGADKIVTEYELVRSYGEYSSVKIRLHSGKTHQIRAHMAFEGHPVVGDEKYGDEALNKKYGVRRQILVAKSLSFEFRGALQYLRGRRFESSFSAIMPKKER